MSILETQLGNPLINISIFVAFVVITLFVVIRVTRGGKKTAGDFYTGGAKFDGRQNGFAIAGDYLSAASFLGIVGAVALYGYDGLLYSVGFLVAPGSWRCCSLPSRCATPGATRWPMC